MCKTTVFEILFTLVTIGNFLRSNFDQNKDHMGIPASEGI